ncbi:hypothetical protein ACFSBZ_03390 [Amnibacterium flavum]|uniref:Uncharacterized protein n=1 Tax=Amnibacterium flavum TaxID=2173173 RepID=A0A2V1HP80_9MICO|nr:hypothetical protein [Amnibacterium flavum]PVZ94443.1 hypothetical protein DDQ50_12080 [Amnibacterium flavum]
MNDIVFLAVWTLMAVGFTILGAFFLRHLDAVTDRFRRLGTGMFGDGIADRMYRRGNLRLGAIAFVIVGPIFVVIGIVSLIGEVSAL